MPRKPKAEFEITPENKTRRVFKDVNADLKTMATVATRTVKVIATVAATVASVSVKSEARLI